MNTTPAVSALADASRTFGLGLTRQLALAGTTNVFMSTLSAQRARLQVDERGTAAAAATAVVVAGVSHRPPRPPFQMVVDRPFLVAIQHVPTGTLLFAGVVGDPTG